ncbi:MAG: GNAT family N-acetyltransferase [Candidatus Latescibacteria bacterium]|nr:GNAT family N-acetyltransferase [Candidatus Latescibacterota bacterium]
MPKENYTLRSVEIDRDADKLAQMWNDSDDQWPGTWCEGVPMTGQRVRDWDERENYLDALIWDTGDHIAGYCSLWEEPDEEGVTYIATLNVSPNFQGRSLARKFLCHYVDRVIEHGSVRLDLNTWSANLKAVPLYKKCGYFWVPGTAVRMQNYLPAILTMPCCSDFFARHDWYSAMQRTLDQNEDEERWQGLKVFTYHFSADDESLTVRVDRQARAVTAVETDVFAVAALPTNIEPARGLETAMRWELTNKSERPLPIALLANGDQDLAIEYRTSLVLEPGASTTLEAPVAVAAQPPQTPAEKRKGVPAVRSVLVVDGQVVELGTGMEPRPAVEISTWPRHITLTPGVPQTVHLQLRSRYPEAVEATLSAPPAPGLHTDWRQQQLNIPAQSQAGIEIELRADETGVHALPVTLSFERDGAPFTLPAHTLTLFALEPGGVLAGRQGDNLRLENENLRLFFNKRGGGLNMEDRHTGENLGFHSGHFSPPMWPSEFGDGRFELTLESGPDGYTATAAMASKEAPGMVLHKRLHFGAGALFSLDYEFANNGAQAHRFRLVHFTGGDKDSANLVLPLRQGLVQGPWSEFPGVANDEFKRPDAYAESWAARQGDNLATVGIMWGQDTEEIEWEWMLNGLTRFYDCPPQSRVRPQRLHFYVGDGDWRSVQRLWHRLHGVHPDYRQAAPRPVPPLQASLQPLAISAAGTLTTTLQLDHHMPRPLQGTARLLPPPGWRVDQEEWALEELQWDRPFTANLKFTGQTGAGRAQLQVRSTDIDADIPLDLICLGDGGKVELTQSGNDEQPVFTLDNGRASFAVTPRFGAALSQWRQDGVDHLHSPFPQVGGFGWMSPWFGGVMPFLMLGRDELPGKLHQEDFTAAAVEAPDRHDIPWQGVRQQADLTHEEGLGMRVEIDTLTVGGAPLVKQVLRLINQTSAVRPVKSGFKIFARPDATQAPHFMGPDHSVKPSNREAWRRSGHWAAACNSDTGRVLGLVTPTPYAHTANWGADGGSLTLWLEPPVPASGQVELTTYLVLAANAAEMEVYSSLKALI